MPLRILIVDDSPVMRTFVRRVVQLSGLEVDGFFQAANGAEALATIASERVDAILTDINMPVMDGEEFVRRMRADESMRATPVIVISTDATAQRINAMLS